MNRDVFLLAVALACTSAGSVRLSAQEARAAVPASDLVTRAELASTGRENLADALRRLRPEWLRLNSARSRFPVVYADSAPLGDLAVLASFNVADVRWVQYSGAEAVERRFGGTSRTPVIHVSTRLPLSAAHPEAPAAPSFEDRPLVSLFAASTSGWGSDVIDGVELSPGIGAGVEVPAMRNVALTAAATFVPGDRGSGATEGSVGLWTGELGLKARLNSDRVLSSFLAASATAYRLRWGTLRSNGAVQGDAFTEAGIGLAVGGGVEARVSRVLLFVRGDVAAPAIEGRWGERLFTLRAGTSFPLGSPR